MLKGKKITLQKLLDFCEKYDKEYGSYPKSIYEGLSFFEFILEEIHDGNI
jgi:hypothetical protein